MGPFRDSSCTQVVQSEVCKNQNSADDCPVDATNYGFFRWRNTTYHGHTHYSSTNVGGNEFKTLIHVDDYPYDTEGYILNSYDDDDGKRTPTS